MCDRNTIPVNEPKPYIQKILTETEWKETKNSGFAPRQSHDQKFIHCTYDHQTDKIINKWYKAKTIYILTLSREYLSHMHMEIIEENGYPHLYPQKGVDLIPIDAIISLSRKIVSDKI